MGAVTVTDTNSTEDAVIIMDGTGDADITMAGIGAAATTSIGITAGIITRAFSVPIESERGSGFSF